MVVVVVDGGPALVEQAEAGLEEAEVELADLGWGAEDVLDGGDAAESGCVGACGSEGTGAGDRDGGFGLVECVRVGIVRIVGRRRGLLLMVALSSGRGGMLAFGGTKTSAGELVVVESAITIFFLSLYFLPLFVTEDENELPPDIRLLNFAIATRAASMIPAKFRRRHSSEYSFMRPRSWVIQCR